MHTHPATLPAHLLREIAVAAGGVDPRSVARVARGEHLRVGAVEDRIRRVLVARGLGPPASHESTPPPTEAA